MSGSPKSESMLVISSRRVPWWTTVAAMLLTLLPVWFAVSQVVMALQGWRLMRGAR